MIQVSYHAQKRFSQRIDACADPVAGVLRMWETGRNATSDDLSLYHVKRQQGQRYRVGFHNHRSGMLIMRHYQTRDSWILTIIPLR